MEIKFTDTPPFDLDFHPSEQLVSVGLINGDLLLYGYAADSSPQRLFKVHAHVGSCRAVRFVNEGQAILTVSSDCSILATDVESGSAIARLGNSHEAPVNRLVNLTIASGDDNGCIKDVELLLKVAVEFKNSNLDEMQCLVDEKEKENDMREAFEILDMKLIVMILSHQEVEGGGLVGQSMDEFDLMIGRFDSKFPMETVYSIF